MFYFLSSSFIPQQALSSPIPSELLVGALPVVPMEPLASPLANERESQHAVAGQDISTEMSDQCVEASPLPSDSEDTPLLCSSPPVQDTGRTFSPPAGPPIALPGPESSVTESMSPLQQTESQVQYQLPHQLQVSQALYAQTQVQIHSPVSQPLQQTQASAPAPPQVQLQPQSLVHPSAHSSPSPLHVSVSVPQQQPDPTAASLSTGGDDSSVQQNSQHSEFNCSYIKTQSDKTRFFTDTESRFRATSCLGRGE